MYVVYCKFDASRISTSDFLNGWIDILRYGSDHDAIVMQGDTCMGLFWDDLSYDDALTKFKDLVDIKSKRNIGLNVIMIDDQVEDI